LLKLFDKEGKLMKKFAESLLVVEGKPKWEFVETFYVWWWKKGIGVT